MHHLINTLYLIHFKKTLSFESIKGLDNYLTANYKAGTMTPTGLKIFNFLRLYKI